MQYSRYDQGFHPNLQRDGVQVILDHCLELSRLPRDAPSFQTKDELWQAQLYESMLPLVTFGEEGDFKALEVDKQTIYCSFGHPSWTIWSCPFYQVLLPQSPQDPRLNNVLTKMYKEKNSVASLPLARDAQFERQRSTASSLVRFVLIKVLLTDFAVCTQGILINLGSTKSPASLLDPLFLLQAR